MPITKHEEHEEHLFPLMPRRGRGGRDRMVVRFTTTYAISAYHN